MMAIRALPEYGQPQGVLQRASVMGQLDRCFGAVHGTGQLFRSARRSRDLCSFVDSFIVFCFPQWLIPIFFFRVTTTAVRSHSTLGAIAHRRYHCPFLITSISVPFHPNPPMAAVSGPVPLTHSAPFRKAQKFSRPPATTTAHGPSDSIGKHASFYFYPDILCFCERRLLISSRTFLLVRTSPLHLHRLLPLKLHG
jgi:hypothetical protein